MTKKQLEDENRILRKICQDLHWMARRYADGRNTYATGLVNYAVRSLLNMGIKLNDTDDIIWARDGGGRRYDGLTDEQATPGTPEAKGEK